MNNEDLEKLLRETLSTKADEIRPEQLRPMPAELSRKSRRAGTGRILGITGMLAAASVVGILALGTGHDARRTSLGEHTPTATGSSTTLTSPTTGGSATNSPSRVTQNPTSAQSATPTTLPVVAATPPPSPAPASGVTGPAASTSASSSASSSTGEPKVKGWLTLSAVGGNGMYTLTATLHGTQHLSMDPQGKLSAAGVVSMTSTIDGKPGGGFVGDGAPFKCTDKGSAPFNSDMTTTVTNVGTSLTPVPPGPHTIVVTMYYCGGSGGPGGDKLTASTVVDVQPVGAEPAVNANVAMSATGGKGVINYTYDVTGSAHYGTDGTGPLQKTAMAYQVELDVDGVFMDYPVQNGWSCSTQGVANFTPKQQSGSLSQSIAGDPIKPGTHRFTMKVSYCGMGGYATTSKTTTVTVS